VDNFLRLAECNIGAHIEESVFVSNACALLGIYNTERVMRVLCIDSVVANLMQHPRRLKVSGLL
jgi:hypothetical protein